MADRLAALGMDQAEFAAIVTERSEGNFMYLRHVLQAVRSRTLGGTDRAALDELPHGLRAYYHTSRASSVWCTALRPNAS